MFRSLLISQRHKDSEVIKSLKGSDPVQNGTFEVRVH